MGSQQMLGLPTERPYESNEDFETLTALHSKNKYEKASTESEKQYHTAIMERLRDTRYVDGENSYRPNTFLVFACADNATDAYCRCLLDQTMSRGFWPASK